MSLTVEEAVAHVPQFASAADLEISPLAGGITNDNYLIKTEEGAFVLRIPGANTGLLGIDRENEYLANKVAGEVGIAPEVVYFVRPEGCLVTRFIDGDPVPREEIGRAENICRVSGTLLEIHSMSTIPGTFSPFRIVEDYTGIARRYDVPFPPNFDWLTARMDQIEAAFLEDPFTPRPCHNDLLNENFLDDGEIRILDWEYAGMGDVFFDLANFSVNHGFSDEQDRWLLECYFDEVTKADWPRLKLMRIMSDFRESVWGMVQIGISELDFDFREYADEHFDRLTRNMTDPRFRDWIEDLTEGV